MKLHALLLVRFDIDSQTFVKLLSLLFEPCVVLFPVYGKFKSARSILFGLELQNDIVGPERLVVSY